MLQFQQPSNAVRRWFSGCLAMLVLFVSIASVSPELHHALHAGPADSHHACGGDEPDCEDVPVDNCEHPCAVALFDQGTTSAMPMVELPVRTDVTIAILPQTAEIVWCGQALIRHSSRAPPIESVV